MSSTVNLALTAPAFLSEGARWFLHSGIQHPSGGVARYYRARERASARISTEITGYSVSTLLYLYQTVGNPDLLDAAIRSGSFLADSAWQPATAAMPFEWAADGNLPEHHSYFFDCGIIARGLFHLWQETADARYLGIAERCCESMLRDFENDTDIHPILELPSKAPIARDDRWSRLSDCYQLKSALAWLQVGEITRNPDFELAFERTLARALESHSAFPEAVAERTRVMDRLHAYCYFLEALLAVADRDECRAALAQGIQLTSRLLREIRPTFVRSDVCAQLLRVRLFAHAQGAVALNETEAAEEAERAASFQINQEEPGHEGGFWFGARDGALAPFVNPVSAAFCLQALGLWHDFRAGRFSATWHDLI